MPTIIEATLWIGLAVVAITYIWAFVLASGVSTGWFIGMLLFGYLLYPFFAAKNWTLMKKNAVAMGSGLLLIAVSVCQYFAFPYK